VGHAETAPVIGLHRTLALAATILGGAAAAASDRTAPASISAVALAERIKAGEPTRLFDLRAREEFERFHIPSAAPTTLAALLDTQLPPSPPIVLYAADPASATQAWTRLRARGYADVTYLRDGLYEWIARVHEPALAIDATAAERVEFERLSELSRYFGGRPRLDVPRAEIPAGYWTVGGEAAPRPSVATSLMVAAIRRRGC
jgi:rhodanese-related sulfurtransferase